MNKINLQRTRSKEDIFAQLERCHVPVLVITGTFLVHQYCPKLRDIRSSQAQNTGTIDIQGRSQTYTAPCNGVVSHGAQNRGFLPTTYAKTNVIQIRPRSLRAVRRFTRVYLHAQTAV